MHVIIIKLPPKQPKTQNDQNNQNLELPFEATEHCTIYDYC